MEKQQQTVLGPADPPHISQKAQPLPSGATLQGQKSLPSPSEQAQPVQDPEGELKWTGKGRVRFSFKAGLLEVTIVWCLSLT